MSDEAQPVGGENEANPPGVLGDGALHAGKGNLVLLRRAAKEGWPIPMGIRKRVVQQMNNIIEMADSDRDKIAASKVLVAADSNNVRRLAVASHILNGAQPAAQTNVQVNVGMQIETHKDWYNNDAHDLIAGGASTPDSNPDGSEPIQAGAVWKAVGQDSDGTSGVS